MYFITKQVHLRGMFSTLKEALRMSSALGSMLKVKGGPLPLEGSSVSLATSSTSLVPGSPSRTTGRYSRENTGALSFTSWTVTKIVAEAVWGGVPSSDAKIFSWKERLLKVWSVAFTYLNKTLTSVTFMTVCLESLLTVMLECLKLFERECKHEVNLLPSHAKCTTSTKEYSILIFIFITSKT